MDVQSAQLNRENALPAPGARRVVISQPMFFPWAGMFEQVRLADVFVHYDDVQFSRGGFTNRVQVKTAQGPQWLTVPLAHQGLQPINQIEIDERKPWRQKHLATLFQNYAQAPFRGEMMALAESVYAIQTSRLAVLNIAALEKVAAYFGFAPKFCVSSALSVGGASSARVAAVTQSLGGTVYITGHGARHYLDHALFEARGIRVEYMDYRREPYPQLHGAFDPHVTILDLIANRGRAGADVICSGTKYWKDFCHE